MALDKASQVVQVSVRVDQLEVLRNAIMSYRTKQHYGWCRHVGKKKEYTVNAPYNEFKKVMIGLKVMEKFACS